MSTFLLVEIADDGTASVTTLSDPITVNEAVTIPLSSLLPPPPAPAPADNIAA